MSFPIKRGLRHSICFSPTLSVLKKKPCIITIQGSTYLSNKSNTNFEEQSLAVSRVHRM